MVIHKMLQWKNYVRLYILMTLAMGLIGKSFFQSEREISDLNMVP